MEEKLQEERMEREKVEVELGREKDCNRVNCLKKHAPLQIGLTQHMFVFVSVFAPARICAGPWAGEGQCDCVPPLCRPLQVQLSETRRELQELKASLRVAQKEKEQLLMEKQARPEIGRAHV